MEAQDIVNQALARINELDDTDEAFCLGERWTEDQIAEICKLHQTLTINRIGQETFERLGNSRIRLPVSFTVSQQGAQGSSAPPPDPWKGKTGPTGPQGGYVLALEAPEIPVTEEMIAAGIDCDYSPVASQGDRNDLTAIYRAMAAKAPPQFDAGFEQGLQSDYLDACARIAALEAENKLAVRDQFFLKSLIDAREAAIVAKDARMAELESELAAFTAPNAPAPSATKEPEVAALTIFDIGWGERRLATQADVDGMEKALWQFYRGRDDNKCELAELRAINARSNEICERQGALLGNLAGIIAALEAEKTALLAENTHLRHERNRIETAKDFQDAIYADRPGTLFSARQAIAAERDELSLWKRSAVDQFAAKDARIAELDTELALRPAALADPEPEPAKPSPFRDFPSDPRRIGR